MQRPSLKLSIRITGEGHLIKSLTDRRPGIVQCMGDKNVVDKTGASASSVIADNMEHLGDKTDDVVDKENKPKTNVWPFENVQEPPQ